jgi:hypothetical protein
MMDMCVHCIYAEEARAVRLSAECCKSITVVLLLLRKHVKYIHAHTASGYMYMHTYRCKEV